MDADKPRRPWWRRKRTWAAVALWLASVYPLSAGPAAYAQARGWLPPREFARLYVPLATVLNLAPEFERATIVPYVRWWEELGVCHRLVAGEG